MGKYLSDEDFNSINNSFNSNTPELTEEDFKYLEGSSTPKVKKEEPKKERSFLDQVGEDLKHGALDAAELTLGGIRALPGGPEIGGVDGSDGFIDESLDWIDKKRKEDPYADELDEDGTPNWFHQALRSTTSSMLSGVGGAIAGGIAGSAVGGPVGTIAGAAIGMGVQTGLIFGGGTADQSYKDAIERGKNPEDALNKAIADGIIEGGIEGIANAAEFYIGGKFGGAGTQVAKNMLKKGTKEFFTPMLKEMVSESIKSGLVEAGTESATEIAQHYNAKRFGLDQEITLDRMANVAGVSFISGLMFAPIATVSTMNNKKQVAKDLINPKTNKEQRLKAAKLVTEEYKKFDSRAAAMWDDYATKTIEAGESINLNMNYSDLTIKMKNLEETAKYSKKAKETFEILAEQKKAMEEAASSNNQQIKPTDTVESLRDSQTEAQTEEQPTPTINNDNTQKDSQYTNSSIQSLYKMLNENNIELENIRSVFNDDSSTDEERIAAKENYNFILKNNEEINVELERRKVDGTETRNEEGQGNEQGAEERNRAEQEQQNVSEEQGQEEVATTGETLADAMPDTSGAYDGLLNEPPVKQGVEPKETDEINNQRLTDYVNYTDEQLKSQITKLEEKTKTPLKDGASQNESAVHANQLSELQAAKEELANRNTTSQEVEDIVANTPSGEFFVEETQNNTNEDPALRLQAVEMLLESARSNQSEVGKKAGDADYNIPSDNSISVQEALKMVGGKKQTLFNAIKKLKGEMKGSLTNNQQAAVDHLLAHSDVDNLLDAYRSEGKKQKTALSPELLETEIRTEIGDKYDKLKASGNLNIVASKKDVPDLNTSEEIKAQDGNTVAGYYNNGKVYLVADGIGQGNAYNIFMHEGVHKMLHGDKHFRKRSSKLLNEFNNLKRSKRIQTAFDIASENNPSADEARVNEEAFAYFMQDERNRNHGIFRKAIALVKQFLNKLKIPYTKLNEADIAYLAVRSVNDGYLKSSAAKGNQGYFSKGLLYPFMDKRKLEQAKKERSVQEKTGISEAEKKMLSDAKKESERRLANKPEPKKVKTEAEIEAEADKEAAEITERKRITNLYTLPTKEETKEARTFIEEKSGQLSLIPAEEVNNIKIEDKVGDVVYIEWDLNGKPKSRTYIESATSSGEYNKITFVNVKSGKKYTYEVNKKGEVHTVYLDEFYDSDQGETYKNYKVPIKKLDELGMSLPKILFNMTKKKSEKEKADLVETQANTSKEKINRDYPPASKNKKDGIDRLISRVLDAKYAGHDAIQIYGEFDRSGMMIKGNNAWAAQTAIDNGIKVFLYHPVIKRWFSNSKEGFVESPAPTTASKQTAFFPELTGDPIIDKIKYKEAAKAFNKIKPIPENGPTAKVGESTDEQRRINEEEAYKDEREIFNAKTGNDFYGELPGDTAVEFNNYGQDAGEDNGIAKKKTVVKADIGLASNELYGDATIVNAAKKDIQVPETLKAVIDGKAVGIRTINSSSLRSMPKELRNEHVSAVDKINKFFKANNKGKVGVQGDVKLTEQEDKAQLAYGEAKSLLLQRNKEIVKAIDNKILSSGNNVFLKKLDGRVSLRDYIVSTLYKVGKSMDLSVLDEIVINQDMDFSNMRNAPAFFYDLVEYTDDITNITNKEDSAVDIDFGYDAVDTTNSEAVAMIETLGWWNKPKDMAPFIRELTGSPQRTISYFTNNVFDLIDNPTYVKDAINNQYATSFDEQSAMFITKNIMLGYVNAADNALGKDETVTVKKVFKEDKKQTFEKTAPREHIYKTARINSPVFLNLIESLYYETKIDSYKDSLSYIKAVLPKVDIQDSEVGRALNNFYDRYKNPFDHTHVERTIDFTKQSINKNLDYIANLDNELVKNQLYNRVIWLLNKKTQDKFKIKSSKDLLDQLLLSPAAMRSVNNDFKRASYNNQLKMITSFFDASNLLESIWYKELFRQSDSIWTEEQLKQPTLDSVKFTDTTPTVGQEAAIRTKKSISGISPDGKPQNFDYNQDITGILNLGMQSGVFNQFATDLTSAFDTNLNFIPENKREKFSQIGSFVGPRKDNNIISFVDYVKVLRSTLNDPTYYETKTRIDADNELRKIVKLTKRKLIEKKLYEREKNEDVLKSIAKKYKIPLEAVETAYMVNGYNPARIKNAVEDLVLRTHLRDYKKILKNKFTPTDLKGDSLTTYINDFVDQQFKDRYGTTDKKNNPVSVADRVFIRAINEVKSELIAKGIHEANIEQILKENKIAVKSHDIFTGKGSKTKFEKSLAQKGVLIGRFINDAKQEVYTALAKSMGADLVVVASQDMKTGFIQGKYENGNLVERPKLVVNAQYNHKESNVLHNIISHKIVDSIVNTDNKNALNKLLRSIQDTAMFKELGFETKESLLSNISKDGEQLPPTMSSQFTNDAWGVSRLKIDTVLDRLGKDRKEPFKVDHKTKGINGFNYAVLSEMRKDPNITKDDAIKIVLGDVLGRMLTNKSFYRTLSKTYEGRNANAKILDSLSKFIDQANPILGNSFEDSKYDFKYDSTALFDRKSIKEVEQTLAELLIGKEFVETGKKMNTDEKIAAMQKDIGSIFYSMGGFYSIAEIEAAKEGLNKVTNAVKTERDKMFAGNESTKIKIMNRVEKWLNSAINWVKEKKPKGFIDDFIADQHSMALASIVNHGSTMRLNQVKYQVTEKFKDVFKDYSEADLEKLHDRITKGIIHNDDGSYRVANKLVFVDEKGDLNKSAIQEALNEGIAQETINAFVEYQKIANEQYQKLIKVYPDLQYNKAHYGQMLRWRYKSGKVLNDDYNYILKPLDNLEGDKEFTKERNDKLSTLDIKKKGLNYRTIDPNEMLLEYVSETEKLINTRKMMDEAIKQGRAKIFINAVEAKRAGFFEVADEAFQEIVPTQKDSWSIELNGNPYTIDDKVQIYVNEKSAQEAAKSLDGQTVIKPANSEVKTLVGYELYNVKDQVMTLDALYRSKESAEEAAKNFDNFTIVPKFEAVREQSGVKIYFEKDLARMLRTVVSRDRFKDAEAFGFSGNSFLKLKNWSTSIEFAFSMFHAFTIGQELLASEMSIDQHNRKSAIFKIMPVNPIKALGRGLRHQRELHTLVEAVLSDPTLSNNKAVRAKAGEIIGTDSPDVMHLINMYFSVGGLMEQDSELRATSHSYGRAKYRSNESQLNINGDTATIQRGQGDSFINSLPDIAKTMVTSVADVHNDLVAKNPDSPIINALKTASFASTQQTTAWLMEYGIPRIKMSVWMKEYVQRIEANKDKLASGELTEQAIAHDTMKFVEDRFGEVNWKSQWMNKSYKSALISLFRSFTWVTGSWKALTKAGVDFGKLGWFTVKDLGEAEENKTHYKLTQKGTWGINAIYSHLMTAALVTAAYSVTAGNDEVPDDEETDITTKLLFPRIDKNDPYQRVTIPSYVTELYKIMHHLGLMGDHPEPAKLISGRLNSIILNTYEAMNGEDWRGVTVRDNHDNIFKQSLDSITHIISIAPISFSSAMQNYNRRGFDPLSLVTSLGGLTTAPAVSLRSAATNRAYQIRREEYKGKKKLPEDIDKLEEISRATYAFGNGNKKILNKMLKQGRISQKKYKNAITRLAYIDSKPNPMYEEPLQKAISGLTILGAIDVWGYMSKREKKQYRAIIIKKYSNVMHRKDRSMEDKQQIYNEMKLSGIL